MTGCGAALYLRALSSRFCTTRCIRAASAGITTAAGQSSVIVRSWPSGVACAPGMSDQANDQQRRKVKGAQRRHKYKGLVREQRAVERLVQEKAPIDGGHEKPHQRFDGGGIGGNGDDVDQPARDVALAD